MSFFKRRQRDKSPDFAAPADPLVAGLISKHEPTFLSALQEAVSMADRGNYKGIQSIREAIRIRSGKMTVSFYQPGIRRGFMSEEMDRYERAEPIILNLAKNHSLLKDPEFTGDYVAALMFSKDSADLENLVRRIFKVGGPRDGYDFQLIYHELRSSARWKER